MWLDHDPNTQSQYTQVQRINTLPVAQNPRVRTGNHPIPHVPIVNPIVNVNGVPTVMPVPIPTPSPIASLKEKNPVTVMTPPNVPQKPLRPNAAEAPVMTRNMRKSMIVQPTAGRTRSQIKPPPIVTNYSIEIEEKVQVYDVAIISDPNEPKTISEALRSDEKEEWKESALIELKHFYVQDSWDYLPRMEAQNMGKNVIGSKWGFKKNVELDGSIRYRSRIVSKG